MRLSQRTVHRAAETSSHRADPTGKSLRLIRSWARPCQALPRKIFIFRFSEICDHLPASRCHREGRRDRHDVGSGERWTRRTCVRRAQVRRGRRKRVVLSPRRWGQARKQACGRRRLTSPVLRGERAICRKPSRRERRCFGVPVAFLSACEPRVRSEHPVLPAPSFSRRVMNGQDSGRFLVAGTRRRASDPLQARLRD